MLHAVNRLPDYQEKSQLVKEICENDVALKEARDEIFKPLVESVRKLIKHTNSPEDSVSLKAIIEHLKIAGLYVEKSEVSHSGSLSITPDHAAKVIDASK